MSSFSILRFLVRYRAAELEQYSLQDGVERSLVKIFGAVYKRSPLNCPLKHVLALSFNAIDRANVAHKSNQICHFKVSSGTSGQSRLPIAIAR